MTYITCVSESRQRGELGAKVRRRHKSDSLSFLLAEHITKRIFMKESWNSCYKSPNSIDKRLNLTSKKTGLSAAPSHRSSALMWNWCLSHHILHRNTFVDQTVKPVLMSNQVKLLFFYYGVRWRKGERYNCCLFSKKSRLVLYTDFWAFLWCIITYDSSLLA